MALTITQLGLGNFGGWTVALIKAVPAPSDYPTHGYALAGGNAGLRTIQNVIPNVSPVGATPITAAPILYWDAVNQKLQAFESGGFTPAGTSANPTINTVTDSGSPTKTLGELTGALSTNGALSGLTGVIAGAFTGTPVGAKLLAECTASTDLSAYQFLLFCFGTP